MELLIKHYDKKKKSNRSIDESLVWVAITVGLKLVICYN